MDNAQIADAFSLLSKLMDIHGENSFKSKSYSVAAFTIDKLPQQLSETTHEKIFSIKGIGESTGRKVIELLTTGEINNLIELINKTPEGVMEMLNIKGIGPKKIAVIWKEMEIETVGELLYACRENRLKLYKGFGEKTQQNVIETIEFYLKSQGSFLFAQVHAIEASLKSFFKKIFFPLSVNFTGAYARHVETIGELELAIDDSLSSILQKIADIDDMELLEKNITDVLYKITSIGLKVRIYSNEEHGYVQALFTKNSSPEFLSAFTQQYAAVNYAACSAEEDIFKQAGIPFIPPFLREQPAVLLLASERGLPALLQVEDIKGIIHSHSTWSDGNNTIEEMAKAAIAKGYEYLVISDHSKSAFYAQGLSEEKILAQHQQIDELNKQLAPFKIFKSIESDILNDGSLDYSEAILSTFDLVIASVHSNLKMQEDKAMMRLMKAIANPYTTILGHMTGRLLLSRKGYPVNHQKIIDACAANKVVIELNAHPSRLDVDWRHIDYALQKNVLISIDPDAHSTEGFNDVYYGVLVAQKAMVTKEQNMSSFGLTVFESFLQNRRR